MIKRTYDNFDFIFQPRRKPQLIFRVASSYFKHLWYSDLNKRPLRNIDISLNYDCNLTCQHCSCEILKKNDVPLTAEQYSHLAKEAIDLGTIYFSFTGGEPLINKDLEDIIQLFEPFKSLIGIQTNGILLTNERINSLIKCGVDVLQVSLDSNDPEEHDGFRNKKDAYSKTIKNMENALAKGLKIIVCTTMTHQNIRSDGILSLLNFLHGKKIPTVISIACPVGKWSGDFSMLLNDEDRMYLDKLKKQYPRLRRDFDSNYSKRGCSAATEKLYITPYGDVIPCPFIHISFGNIKEEPLHAIQKRMLKLDRFIEYNNICLAGEDKSFIEQYISPTYENQSLPQKWTDHPVLSKSLR